MCPLSFKERKVGHFCCLGQVLLCPEETQGVEAQLSWWKPQPKTCTILPLGPIWGYPVNTYMVWPVSTKPVITLNVTEWLPSSRLSIHIPGRSELLLYFIGNLASLQICHLTLALYWLLFLYIQSAVSDGRSVTRVRTQAKESNSWLPGVSESYKLGRGKQWGSCR